ncbi:hypothetical protein OFM52_30135, partial [Escherichia coli]|nr:hypothetical protein [Escherichia coli]
SVFAGKEREKFVLLRVLCFFIADTLLGRQAFQRFCSLGINSPEPFPRLKSCDARPSASAYRTSPEETGSRSRSYIVSAARVMRVGY